MAKAPDRAALSRAPLRDSDSTPTTREDGAPRAGAVGLLGPRSRWRREYSYITAVVLIVSIFGFVFFALGWNLADLQRFEYAGIFLISLIGSASVILPLPGAAVVVSSGQFVGDVGGIPFWLVVGIVAAAGETIGEMTAYLAGMGGKVVIEDRASYRKLDSWMQRRGVGTMFVLSVVPNPVFDIAGFMAGAVRMPIWQFALTVFVGKTIKNCGLAAGGDAGLDAIFGN